MAGSAGSPHVLTVHVCPIPKCLMVTVIPADEIPEGFRGSLCYGEPRAGRRHDPVMKVEYVPREQSLENGVASTVRRLWQSANARDHLVARELEELLDSYREAAAEEDEASG